MSYHYLTKLFKPESIAVFGASERPESVGGNAFQNLIAEPFAGNIYPINPKHDSVLKQTCYPSVDALPTTPDLAVIATPATSIPAIIQACGEAGVGNAVILSAGFEDAAGKRIQQQMQATAKTYGMRLIGPNCLGIMRPDLHLNATFSKNQAVAGSIALVSQSGAICTAVLDWAEANGVGFSQVVSTGDAADVDFGEVLDFLALDPKTKSILLYIEGVSDARRFMSGLKTAARMKPVILLKSGRMPEGSKAAVSHTGALIGGDDVFDAAIERAGAVRAQSIAQLFSAAKTLSHGIHIQQNRLAIVTNGGGPGVMATDRAAELGVKLPALTAATLSKLNACLPAHWSHNNPIDILGDATAERYVKALQACAEDPNYDAILVLLTPQAMSDPTAIAKAIIAHQDTSQKPLLTAWLGESLVSEARHLFSQASIPTFRTPEAAVEAFTFIADYHNNQRLLMQTPASSDECCNKTDIAGARTIIEAVLANKQSILSGAESRAILRAFNIPITPAIEVQNANQAMVAAESLGFPVSMKINSVDLTHKSDVGGVKLNLHSVQAVRSAFNKMMADIQHQYPQANIQGVTLEPMYREDHARELLVGVSRDPVFGPAMTFGSGGTSVEVIKDQSIGLPPLNLYMTQRMLERTKVAKMLTDFRGLPNVDLEAISQVLLKISFMVSQLPEILELDINPLFANENGVMAVDARIRVAARPINSKPYQHMAIHPYPSELEQHLETHTGLAVYLRPIRPEDAGLEIDFVKHLSQRSRYLRFMNAIEELSPQMLSRFTQIDYDREMAFIALAQNTAKQMVEVGIARYTMNPDGQSCEMAMVVRDDYQHEGIGKLLLHALIEQAKRKGLRTMQGEVLSENQSMLKMVRHFGFSVTAIADEPAVMAINLALS